MLVSFALIFERMLAIIGFPQTCGLDHGAVLPRT